MWAKVNGLSAGCGMLWWWKGNRAGGEMINLSRLLQQFSQVRHLSDSVKIGKQYHTSAPQKTVIFLLICWDITTSPQTSYVPAKNVPLPQGYSHQRRPPRS